MSRWEAEICMLEVIGQCPQTVDLIRGLNGLLNVHLQPERSYLLCHRYFLKMETFKMEHWYFF